METMTDKIYSEIKIQVFDQIKHLQHKIHLLIDHNIEPQIVHNYLWKILHQINEM